MTSLARRLIVGGVVAALVGGGAYAGWLAWYAEPAQPEFRLAKVERGAITAAVSSTGTLSAVTTVQVGSQISGQIREIHVDFNSPVKKGQIIARIDPESFELKVSQSQADLDAARTQLVNQQGNLLVLRSQLTRTRILLEDARFDHQRKHALAEKGFISGAERDKSRFAFEAAAEQVRTAEAQIKVGEAQVENAAAVVKQREAQLAQARVDLERTFIRAPVDGTVILRNVDAGQTVAASLQAPVLFTIAQDLRAMQVEVAIDEADVGRLRVGQTVTFTVDAYPARTFRGEVRQIRKAAQVSNNVVTYTVVVGAANPELILLPGMTANVRVIIESRDDVLKVPNAALRYRPRTATASTGGSAQAEEDAGPGGNESVQARQARLTRELALTPDQQARLKSLFDEAGTRMASIRSTTTTSLERRRDLARARLELRNRIAEILGPEQLVRYQALIAEETSGRAAVTVGRVFVRGTDGTPREVSLRLGLTDGNATEILETDLTEGAEVIVGTVAAGKGARKGAAPNLKL